MRYLIALQLLLCAVVASATDALRRDASWQTPDVEQIAAMLAEGLEQQGTGDEQIEAALATLRSQMQLDNFDALDAYVAAAASVVPAVEQVVEQANRSPTAVPPDALTPLADSLRPSVAVWLARSLARLRLYDEAQPLLEFVDPLDTVDPAATLFYRAACNHALLAKEQTIEDLERLLENEKDAPVRFARTARLMLADIQPLEEDSLDEISRLMNDVGRRLDLGRSGETVQEREQDIIDKLTKLIDKIEEQQQQQQQQQQSQAGGGNSQGGQDQPMSDSQIAGANGAGDVDRKDLGDRSGWGNLPPAERQEALQQISRELPTHYREAIEAYFRKMATEPQ